MKKFAIAGAIVLAACGPNMPIQRVSNSQSHFGSSAKGLITIMHADTSGAAQYRVFSEGGSVLVPISEVRLDDQRRADKFCDQKNGVVRALSENMSTPPYTLANLPKVEIVFVCVTRENPATLQSTAPANVRGDVYIRTTELQRLLDEGVITQKDFDTEMTMILNHP